MKHHIKFPSHLHAFSVCLWTVNTSIEHHFWIFTAARMNIVHFQYLINFQLIWVWGLWRASKLVSYIPSGRENKMMSFVLLRSINRIPDQNIYIYKFVMAWKFSCKHWPMSEKVNFSPPCRCVRVNLLLHVYVYGYAITMCS